MKDNDFNPTVELSLETLLRECISPLYEGKESSVRFAFNSQNNENIHQVFKYRRYTDTFSDLLTVNLQKKNDGKRYLYFQPSYNEFLIKLQIILNIRIDDLLNEEKVEKALKERIQVLKETKDLSDLKRKFPEIHKDYKAGVSKLDEISARKKHSYRLSPKAKEDLDNEERYVYRCAILRNFKKFRDRQVTFYTRCIAQRKELKERYENQTYNGFINSGFDKDRLFMYLIYKYLCKCEQLQNKKEIQAYIDIVEDYLKSDKDKSFKLTSDTGEIISLALIEDKLEKVKKRIDDTSYNLPWVIAKPGKPVEVVRSSTKKKPYRETIFNQKQLQNLRNAGARKEAFYSANVPEIRVIGLEKYNGYMGYIYPNGKVVLDKVYNSNAPSTATGNAIFIVDAKDFETLSRKDKTSLSKDPRVRKLTHRGAWEERVKEIIDKEGTKEEIAQAKSLIKRIKETNGC